jgi:hypothetical protein
MVETIIHQLSFERAPRLYDKPVCTTHVELDRVVSRMAADKAWSWADTTHSLLRDVEFRDEALERIMSAGLEALGRKVTHGRGRGAA